MRLLLARPSPSPYTHWLSTLMMPTSGTSVVSRDSQQGEIGAHRPAQQRFNAGFGPGRAALTAGPPRTTAAFEQIQLARSTAL